MQAQGATTVVSTLPQGPAAVTTPANIIPTVAQPTQAAPKVAAAAQVGTPAQPRIVSELVIEEISIDGMCGVY